MGTRDGKGGGNNIVRLGVVGESDGDGRLGKLGGNIER